MPWIAAGPAKSRLEGAAPLVPLPRRRTREPVGGRRAARRQRREDRVVLQEVGRQPPDDQRQAARRPRLVPPAFPRGLEPRRVSVGHHDARGRLLGADAKDGRLDATARRQGGRAGAGAARAMQHLWARTTGRRIVLAARASSGVWPWRTPKTVGRLLYAGGKTPPDGRTPRCCGVRGRSAARSSSRARGSTTGKRRSGRSSEERVDRRATGRRSSSSPRRAAGY